jgi:hypothetical protein
LRRGEEVVLVAALRRLHGVSILGTTLQVLLGKVLGRLAFADVILDVVRYLKC